MGSVRTASLALLASLLLGTSAPGNAQLDLYQDALERLRAGDCPGAVSRLLAYKDGSKEFLASQPVFASLIDAQILSCTTRSGRGVRLYGFENAPPTQPAWPPNAVVEGDPPPPNAPYKTCDELYGCR